MSDQRDRWRGALLGTALGDATGRPFEGSRRVASAQVEAWLDGDEPLVWTDDTAMTLALASSLVATGGEVDPQHLGDTFAAAYRDEPWRGYGAGPPAIFATAAAGTPYLEAAAALFGGTGSHGNGGAMRAAPAAIVGGADLGRVGEVARAQARVTHAHELGQDGAALAAMAVATLAMRPGPAADAVAAVLPLLRTRELRDAADRALALGSDVDGDIAAVLGTGVTAVQAVPAAIAAFLRGSDDPRATLVGAITLGGDTDTIAAMAGAMVGAFLGASAFDPSLLARLEQRDRLTAAADDLVALAAGAGGSR